MHPDRPYRFTQVRLTGVCRNERGRFVMDSQLGKSNTAGDVQRTVRTDGAVTVRHPRGAGFRVLSKIARSRAADDGYAPRHRLDAEPDRLPAAVG